MQAAIRKVFAKNREVSTQLCDGAWDSLHQDFIDKVKQGGSEDSVTQAIARLKQKIADTCVGPARADRLSGVNGEWPRAQESTVRPNEGPVTRGPSVC